MEVIPFTWASPSLASVSSAARLFQQTTQRTLATGESLDFGGYTMRYDGFTEGIADDGRQMEIADVSVIQNGQVVANLRPRHDIYPDMPMTIAGSYSTISGRFLCAAGRLGANGSQFRHLQNLYQPAD